MSFENLRIGLVGPLPPPSGGMANQTRQLAELLADGGAAVTLVQTNRGYRPGWVARVPVLRAFFRLLPYLVALWRMAGRVDVVHVMANSGWAWHLFAAPAVWMARWRGVPVLVNYRGGEAAAFLRRSHRLVRFTMRRATLLAVPSRFLYRVFSEFGIAAEVLPNIVDLGRFSPAPREGEAPHLIVARNLEKLYDNETAIRAFQIVQASFPQARLSIAGSGPEEERLRRFVDAQGLGDTVRFCGRLEREEMARLYRSADVMMNPSLADNMPNSVLEAWSSGLAVVSTNVGGIPDLVQDGVNASLVPPADVAGMADACLVLLGDRAKWQAQVDAGLREVQRFTWTCVQPVLLDLYRRAMQLPSAGSRSP